VKGKDEAMKHKLSFASVNILDGNIAEVIIDPDVEISLEMTEEYNDFLVEQFAGDFAVLVNKLHPYDFTFEAKLTVASHENLKAIAVVYYSEQSVNQTYKINNIRAHDWNLKAFSGLDIGWQQAHDWLKVELS